MNDTTEPLTDGTKHRVTRTQNELIPLREEAIRLRIEHRLSAEEIGRRLKVAGRTALTWLANHPLSADEEKLNRGAKLDVRAQAIRLKLENRWSNYRIAEELNESPSNIRNWTKHLPLAKAEKIQLNELRQEAIRLRVEENKTTTEIVKITGGAATTINRYLKNYPVRHEHHIRNQRLTQLELQHIIDLRTVHRKSIPEIVAVTGLSKTTIYYHLRAFPLTEEEQLNRRRQGQQIAVTKRHKKARIKTGREERDREVQKPKTRRQRPPTFSGLSTAQIGTISEKAVQFRLALHGIDTYSYCYENSKCDFVIVDEISQKTLKVQVKTVAEPSKRRPHPHINITKKENGKRRRYASDEMDILAGYDPCTDTVYVYSAKEIEHRNIYINIDEAHAERWSPYVKADRKLTSREKGNIAESAVLFRLALHGFETYFPTAEGYSSDGIAISKSNPSQRYRIQIKWACSANRKEDHNVTFKLTTGNYNKRRYTKEDFDYLMGYDVATDAVYIWHSDELLQNSETVSLDERVRERWDKIGKHSVSGTSDSNGKLDPPKGPVLPDAPVPDAPCLA